MPYLNTTWIKQPYPETKRWLWYRNGDYPTADLYISKDKQRGVVRLPDGLYKVVVSEINGQMTIKGELATKFPGGNVVQEWMLGKECIPAANFTWADDGQYSY